MGYSDFSMRLVRRAPGLAAQLGRAHAQLIRLSGGRMRRFVGAPMLVLRTVGRRSGKTRETPTLYLPDDDRYVIVASNAAADRTPGWYYNLRAAGEAEVVVEGRAIAVSASEAEGPERERLLTRIGELYGGFGDYQRVAKRRLPVMVLTPHSGS